MVQVHAECRRQYTDHCSLGEVHNAILPPSVLQRSDSIRKGMWEPYKLIGGSPILGLVNSRSGDNQGVKFLRRLKQILNPLQVFDLATAGPELGFCFFARFEKFRVLACGGDGTYGWVLSTLDKLGMHSQCYVMPVPLGTGNDLSRVLGWGSSCDDDDKLYGLLREMDNAAVQMLDRWSIQHETSNNCLNSISETSSHSQLESSHDEKEGEKKSSLQSVEKFGKSLSDQLTDLLYSDNDTVVITSARKLADQACQFIGDFLDSQSSQSTNDPVMAQCCLLRDKLKSLVVTLSDEAEATTSLPTVSQDNKITEKTFRPREALMARANSLKKAVKGLLDQTELAVDTEASVTEQVKVMTCNALNAPAAPPPLLKQSSVSPSLHSQSGQLDAGKEVAAMNNYCGIGLDAKISYEFHTRREENPGQYTSRAKNMVLMGYLGGKELLQNSQRNISQRISLECDGKKIRLPRKIQGVVVLNIGSYMAGTNFWGTDRGRDGFSAPSIDDRLVEVVAVTGATHMATAKVLGIQNCRLAQCRSLKITIAPGAKVPMQVDGEAWLQDPGVLMIVHKNRARMLAKNKDFALSLRSWQDQHKPQKPRLLLKKRSNIMLLSALPEAMIDTCMDLAGVTKHLFTLIQEESLSNVEVEKELLAQAISTNRAMDRIFPNDQVSLDADAEHLEDFKRHTRALIQETQWFLTMKKVSVETVDMMECALKHVEIQTENLLQRMGDDPLSPEDRPRVQSTPGSMLSQEDHTIPRLSTMPALHCHRQRSTQVANPHPSSSHTSEVAKPYPSNSHTSAAANPSNSSNSSTSSNPLTNEVAGWSGGQVVELLVSLGLEEYKEKFELHNITGKELLTLQQQDMTELGMDKVTDRNTLWKAVHASTQDLSVPPVSMTIQITPFPTNSGTTV